MKKVAVVTPWLYRDNFVPIYNYIWGKQTYKNYDVHIFEESNTFLEKKNSFNKNFFIHKIEVANRISIGAKLNYAFNLLNNNYDYDYVMIASSDDYYGSDYISNCVNFMESNQVDIINMMGANYVILKSKLRAVTNSSQSYSGLFFFKSELLKHKWNESFRAGEDRMMLKYLVNKGYKHISNNINQNSWLGIIHGQNYNTVGRGTGWLQLEKSWLIDFLKNDEFLLNFYFSFGDY